MMDSVIAVKQNVCVAFVYVCAELQEGQKMHARHHMWLKKLLNFRVSDFCFSNTDRVLGFFLCGRFAHVHVFVDNVHNVRFVLFTVQTV